jgi:hypothetical protein
MVISNQVFCQTQLSEQKTFQKVFTTAEIQDLQLLFDFFIETICQDMENENLDRCFQLYQQRLSKVDQIEDIELMIPIERQLDVYEEFSGSTFNEIWYFGWAVYREKQSDTLKMIHLKPDGKYLKFLKLVGKKDKLIKRYYDIVMESGDVSVILIADLLVNYQDYNIEDPRIKFIIAIHYLTLNDQRERRENFAGQSDG